MSLAGEKTSNNAMLIFCNRELYVDNGLVLASYVTADLYEMERV